MPDDRNLTPGGGGGVPETGTHALPVSFDVELPSGGRLHLQTEEEVDLWEESSRRYIEDYGLSQQNDLILLGAILTQQLAMFRAQARMNGMEAEFDADGLPTGRYKKTALKASDMTAAQTIIIKAATEIRELEKALGIDKKTREQGGQQTVAGYVGTLKEAAREYGLHISKRVKAYEQLCMDARWKLRVLRNGDAEDRQYEGISEASILNWLEEELAKLEEIDKQYANERGRLYLGAVR